MTFAARLLRWFAAHRRDLPWRRGRTPYRVLVSEVMLQQTTAAAVAPYFSRFVDELPGWRALAQAPLPRVLALWSGLGYYRRARALHAAARAVVERHGGRLPRDPERVGTLPGVGAYTAAAVLSIAHGARLAAVDGNVARVVSRHRGLALRHERSRDRRVLEDAVLALMGSAPPGEVNEALIELGATTCTPRAPACRACPVCADCVARLEGRVHELPPGRKRPASRRVDAAAAVVLRRGRVLVRRRGEDDPLLAGLWELPGGFTRGERAGRWLERNVLAPLGGGAAGDVLGTIDHAVTTRRIRLELLSCTLRRSPPRTANLRWLRLDAAEGLALTAATARALGLLRGRSQ